MRFWKGYYLLLRRTGEHCRSLPVLGPSTLTDQLLTFVITVAAIDLFVLR